MKNIVESQKKNTKQKSYFIDFFQKQFLPKYKLFFSIKEIEGSKVLQWFFGAMLLVFFIAFSSWIHSGMATVEAVNRGIHLCWPYFQNCGDWYFLQALPQGYSQNTLYMFFFGIMLLIVFLMWKRNWVVTHMLMTILFVWEFLLIFVLSQAFSGNYDYYHVVLTFILLFLPFKLFFLKLTFVVFYFLASTIKIRGWIPGTYFTSLQTGLPIFPDAITPLITNFVIFAQAVGAWFLMSKNKIYQRVALLFFVIFHLYSGILVGYRYPATVLPGLLILFGPLYQFTQTPLFKKSLAGWMLVAMLFVFEFIPIIIPGDQRITLEGNQFGLYMFEANHQCVSTVEITKKDGTKKISKEESLLARNRCDPYARWFRLKQMCIKTPLIQNISWKFDHSINGGPFYRIVDEENACTLEYRAFSHNTWIKTPEEGASLIGYPVKNIFYNNSIK